jgi:predicted ferric reductase
LLIAVAELAGMVGAYAVCLQLLLIARVEPVERAIGHDRLVGWHRVVGTATLGLVCLHVVAMVVGGGLLTGQGAWAELRTEIATMPDVLIAVIGTAIFIVAGLSCGRALRRFLSYEAWYLLHTAFYVGVFLTFFHQLSVGPNLGTGWVRGIWIAMYVVTAAAVLTWRVLLPLSQWRHRILRVEAVVPESPGMVSVWLRGRGLDRLGARPGQFVLLRFLVPGHRLAAHPYSLSLVTTPERMRVTVAGLGDHSRALAFLRPGTRAIVEGPFGAITPERAQSDKVLLIAGGAGIGPVRALAEGLLHAGRDVVVMHRAHSGAELGLGRELTDVAGLGYIPLPGRRADLGYDPLAPGPLRRIVPDLSQREIFVCGPPAMVSAVIHSARVGGVPRAAGHFEEMSLS